MAQHAAHHLRRGASTGAPLSLGPANRTAGFTIVELVVVIGLLGVLSIVALARFVKPSAFVPGIVNHAIVTESRFAQQLAASRADAVVTFLLDRAGDDWRFRVSTDVDGLVRDERVGADNTSVVASSGAASAGVDATTVLQIRYAISGDLADVQIGGNPGDPALGVALTTSGDSNRDACIYPSGYTSDAPCT